MAGAGLPRESDYDQNARFREAVAKGEVVYASCMCTVWWLAAKDVTTNCSACGEPMLKVPPR